MNREYFEQLRANNGSAPERVDQSRFWDMLEVLPPCKWTRLRGSESFYISEAETTNLHTWMVRIGQDHFEMVAPNNLTHEEVLARVFAAFPALLA